MKNVIIDCDTGIDDSIALLYAMKNPFFRIQAITTVFGNTSAKQAADNSLRLIRLAQPEYDIPVAVGAERSIDGTCDPYPVHIHGHNGIGDQILPESDEQPICDEAARLIVRLAEETHGELSLITLGRLTNIARALDLDPNLPAKVKDLTIMGGCLHRSGNVTPYAEANIIGDARAADIVLGAGFRTIVVGLDVTTTTFISDREINRLITSDPAIYQYVSGAMDYYFQFAYESEGFINRSYVHDPLAVLIAEDPTLAKYEMIRARVEYQSKEYCGMIKAEPYSRENSDREPVLYAFEVDADKAVRRLMKNL